MADPKFDVYFSGQILDGFDPSQVRQKVGAIFKANEAMLGKLFSGQPVKVKGGVDQDTAIKYKLTFRKAGASVEIKAVRSEAVKPAPVAKPASKPVAKAFSSAAKPVYTSAPEGKPGLANLDYERGMVDIAIPDANFSLDPEGVMIDQSPPEKPKQIAITTELELNPANVGSLEDCAVEEEPQVISQTTHLELL